MVHRARIAMVPRQPLGLGACKYGVFFVTMIA
jgi:hypothetical protein